jgi:hypothetical protein
LAGREPCSDGRDPAANRGAPRDSSTRANLTLKPSLGERE